MNDLNGPGEEGVPSVPGAAMPPRTAMKTSFVPQLIHGRLCLRRYASQELLEM